MSANKDKTRTTKNSQRVKTLAEQQQVYEQVLAKSIQDDSVPKDAQNPALVAGSSQDVPDDLKNRPEQSPHKRASEDDESNHVEKHEVPTTGEDKTKEAGGSGKPPKRHHSISSEHDSSDDQDNPPSPKVPKKGDPSLIKKRKLAKPKGRKSAPSAAAGSEAQAQFQLNQTQMPFVNPNVMQNSGFQQNQDPFALMANLSRLMFNSQLNQGQFQNQFQPGPQFQNPPIIAQTPESSSEEDESEDGEDLPSDPENAKQQSVPKTQTTKDESPGTFDQECEEECKVILQDDDMETGPDAPEKLVNMIKNFIGRNKKQANVEELLQQFPRPKNMPFLKSPKIETDLFPKLAKYIKSFDGGCRLLQQYINAAITALVGAMTIILKREKLHEDLSKAGSLVKNAVKLLAYTNKDINCRRKDALRNTVNADCLPLLKHNRPSSEDWLLGQNLADSIKELEESKKVSEKVLKPKKDFSQGAQNQNYKGKRFRYKKGNKKGRYPHGKQDTSQGGYNTFHHNQPTQWQGFQSAGLSQPYRNQQQAQYGYTQTQYNQNQTQNWKQQGQNNFQYNNNNNNNNGKRKN